MGLLLQNISKFQKEYLAANGAVEDTVLKRWFGNQKAIKRNCSLNEIEFEPKSAVMIVGVSGIGKTSYAQEFLANHPEFEFCSYDECFYQACSQENEQVNVSDATKDAKTKELFEKMIRNANRHNKSIVLDGLFINYAFRAAILNTLQVFGYKIHVVYFNWQYVTEKKNEVFTKRAVELYLFSQFTNMKVSTIGEALKFRQEIIELNCKEYGMKPEEIYEKYASHPKVREIVARLLKLMENEVVNNFVLEQEKQVFFTYGAHYYYEINPSPKNS